jgi:hypothetical protein
MKRTGDEGQKSYFRTDRLFLSNGEYFFSTREGVDQGPYATRDDAEKALRHYLQTQSTMQRLRGRSRADDDATFNKGGVASIAKDIRARRKEKAGLDDPSDR